MSLVPICNKVLERLIHNNVFKHRVDNNLISENQYDFKQGDSCSNQLLSITQKRWAKYDKKDLYLKLKQNGISDKLLDIIIDKNKEHF